MRKHKLFLPVLFAFILFFGTSIALGVFYFGGSESTEAYLVDNASTIDPPSIAQAESGPEPQPEPEQSASDLGPEEEEQITILDGEAEEVPLKKNTEKPAKVEAKKQTDEKPKQSTRQPAKKKDIATVSTDSLNVRPTPSTSQQPIDALSRGQKVEVLGEENNWLQVKLVDGRVGWVSGLYVDRPSSPGSSGSLAGKVIAIDPGHGGSDPGAVGVTGLQEKVVNLDVSLRVASKLRSLGAKVVMTRDTDVFIPLDRRPAIARAAGAHVFVSVHSNAHSSAQIGGTETYYYSSASQGLASHMQRRLVAALGLRDIGAKHGNFLVIRQTSMPAVLLELGFLSNAHEESLLRTDGFRQKAADAIVQALLDYFK